VKRHGSFVFIVGVGLLVVAGAAYAGEAARVWLDRMNTALEELNYVGTFVHLHAGKAETKHVAHRYVDGKVHERIVSLDGVGREIIRLDENVRCILPDRKVVLLEEGPESSPLVSALPGYSRTLEAHYHLKTFSTDRIADRQAQVVGIFPRDDYRFGYLLWLDVETAMPLRVRLWGEDKQTIEEILFTSIEFPQTIPDAAFMPSVATEGFTELGSQQPPSEIVPGVAWRVANLPDGFELTVSTRKAMADSPDPVEHLVYSDGLATVSVFIEKSAAETDVAEGFSTVGSANAFSLSIADRRVTAIGEVPRKTVETIATSLESR
jgi:sigma-E factor negative regulatory protein RseB